ncbi:MAG: ABC transporter permease subunit [Oscillospiraceae bacterium]|nr:ABC transporter permease subunit [Oscillospiraceae bacterium]
MGAIFRREMGAFFTSPIAYIFLGVFYIMSGFFFANSSIAYQTADMSGTFGSVFTILLFLIPLMTMKLFSEEKRQKTEQGLLTAPVGLLEIVLGKYFAALVLYTIGISIFLLFALILEFFGSVAWASVLSNFLALWFLGAAFIAVTLFVSSLTENQIVSAIVGFIALMILFMIDSIASMVPVKFIADVLTSLSFYSRYNEFVNGLFNLSSVMFYISVAVLFNFFTVRVFEKRRWS